MMSQEEDDDLHFSSTKQSLQEVLDGDFELPGIVRVVEKYQNLATDKSIQIPADCVVYLERKVKVGYVHVKVLDVHDEEEASREYGCDFIYERGMYLDEEYLIPVKYPGKLKFDHRPGRSTRYVSIAQVLEDMPRLVRTEEDVVAIPPAGIGANTVVPALTLLQIKRRFQLSVDNTVYLQCSNGLNNYAFSEHTRINFTAVRDNECYRLEQLMKWHSLHLPAVIQFQTLDIESIVHFCDDLASCVKLITEGPVEIIGWVETELLVGWVRHSNKRTYKTLILPQATWPLIQVQKSTIDSTMTEHYFKRKFKDCPDSSFVETGLYSLNLQQKDAVWLRSPKLFKPNLRGSCMTTVVPIDFQDSSEEEDDNPLVYDEIKPPIPRRVPLKQTSTDSTDKDPEQFLDETIKRKKKLFGNVHTELKRWFGRKITKRKDPNSRKVIEFPNPLPPVPDLGKPINKVTKPLSRSLSIPNYPLHNKLSNTKYKATIPEVPRRHSETDLNAENTDPEDDESKADEKGEYEVPVKADNRPPAIPPRPPKSSRQDRYSYYKLPSETSKESNDVPDKPNKTYFTKTGEKGMRGSSGADTYSRPYEQINLLDMTSVMKPGQKEDDFYILTVLEVSQLFKICKLENMAKICYDMTLDGGFFDGLDLDTVLSDDPFNASKFDILKIRQIIEKGWRPKFDQ